MVMKVALYREVFRSLASRNLQVRPILLGLDADLVVVPGRLAAMIAPLAEQEQVDMLLVFRPYSKTSRTIFVGSVVGASVGSTQSSLFIEAFWQSAFDIGPRWFTDQFSLAAASTAMAIQGQAVLAYNVHDMILGARMTPTACHLDPDTVLIQRCGDPKSKDWQEPLVWQSMDNIMVEEGIPILRMNALPSYSLIGH